MEKFHSYDQKFTPEQIKRFNKIITENGLKDEDPDNFVIHAGEKTIRIAKKEELDLLVDKKRSIEIPIEEAVQITIKYPNLPLSEALKKLREK